MAFMELTAGPNWQAVDFISDLHLQVSEPATFNVWQRYMQTTSADAVFMLGDLFEVWVGDDVLQEHGFEQQCAQIVEETSARVPTFFMHGNRDFLVGKDLMSACNTMLQTPQP
jgi:UDP-2,3-diacylglucosamine hydrolase